MKHTPGPWQHKIIKNKRIVIKENNPSFPNLNEWIGVIHLEEKFNQITAIANAKLIAAAPDLLETCKLNLALDLPYKLGMNILIEAGYNKEYGYSRSEFVKTKTNEAIKKAEGV